MALDAHLVELSEKHRALDRKIEEEQARPMADRLKLAEWKPEWNARLAELSLNRHEDVTLASIVEKEATRFRAA